MERSALRIGTSSVTSDIAAVGHHYVSNNSPMMPSLIAALIACILLSIALADQLPSLVKRIQEITWQSAPTN